MPAAKDIGEVDFHCMQVLLVSVAPKSNFGNAPFWIQVLSSDLRQSEFLILGIRQTQNFTHTKNLVGQACGLLG